MGSWYCRGGGWWSGPSPGVRAVAAVQQGLRKAARDGGGDDLLGDGSTHGAQVGAGGVKCSRLFGAPDVCLQNSL